MVDQQADPVVVNHGPDDPEQVSLARPSEQRYWMDQFGVSEAQLTEAIALVGCGTADVEALFDQRALNRTGIEPG